MVEMAQSLVLTTLKDIDEESSLYQHSKDHFISFLDRHDYINDTSMRHGFI